MRLLVTGAAGFIGSSFVRYWRRHHRVAAVVARDALTYAGVRSNVDAAVPFVRAGIGDLSTVESVLRTERIDVVVVVVVNLAAESHNSGYWPTASWARRTTSGSGVEISVASLAERVLDVLGLPHSMITTVPDRPGHDRTPVNETAWTPA